MRKRVVNPFVREGVCASVVMFVVLDRGRSAGRLLLSTPDERGATARRPAGGGNRPGGSSPRFIPCPFGRAAALSHRPPSAHPDGSGLDGVWPKAENDVRASLP